MAGGNDLVAGREGFRDRPADGAGGADEEDAHEGVLPEGRWLAERGEWASFPCLDRDPRSVHARCSNSSNSSAEILLLAPVPSSRRSAKSRFWWCRATIFSSMVS